MLAGETFQDVVDVKPIEEHFAERGLTFDDIDTFVQTHLDWDHCMNTTKFRRSRILIQRAEWTRIPVHPLFASTYAPKEHYEEISRLNVEFVEGDVRGRERGPRRCSRPATAPAASRSSSTPTPGRTSSPACARSARTSIRPRRC